MDATLEMTGKIGWHDDCNNLDSGDATMYDYDMILDIDELALAFEHCAIIEISTRSVRLQQAARVLEENGVIEVIGKRNDIVAYGRVVA